MKRYFSAFVIGLSLLCISGKVLAQDELVVLVLKTEAPFEGASLSLDGQDPKTVPSSGLVSFDLEAGAHSLQLLENGSSLHSFRFNSAAGQLADVTLLVAEDNSVDSSVETFNQVESIADRTNAPLGSLSGTVRLSGSAIAGATVAVEGLDEVAITDEEGRYSITLPRGLYDFVIDHPNATDEQEQSVRLVSNLTVGADFNLSRETNGLVIAPSFQIEEVLVLGSVSSSDLGVSEQFSDAVVNTIGIEQLARYGDSDIAASVVRVPAVTVQDDKYVFIRGLGGRYITTTLNGATMPSTDPNKRTVPLDLFPSNIVDSLQIRKSFLAPYPGETTGGNLAIETRSFPDERSGGISISIGGNTSVTGDSVVADSLEGDWDIWGVDDGARELNPITSAVARVFDPDDSNQVITDYLNDAAEIALREIGGETLIDGLDLNSATASPDISIGANFGDLIYFGDADFGYFAAANYKNSWSAREGVSNTFENDGGAKDIFSDTKVSNHIDLSGLLSLSLNIGNSTLESVTLLSRVTDSSVQVLEGFDGDQGEESVRHNIDWIEQQFVSQQFLGEHQLTDALVIDWQATASQAGRYAPDRREVRFDLEPAANGVFNLEVPSLLRRFDDLVDDNTDVSLDLVYETEFDSSWYMSAKFDLGVQAISRERDSDSNSYGLLGGLFVDDQAPNLLVSDVLTEASVTGDSSTGYSFSDKTLASDSYDAEMDLNSYYLAADLIVEDLVQILVGARHEDFDQLTNTFNIQTDQAAPALIDEAVTLPSLAVNWFYGDDQQLRFAWSETVSRPDFKEVSNAVFYDSDFSDIRVRGNPDLQISSVSNFDLRWESYGEGQDKLSVALFYKEIEDAIERVELTASGTAGNSRTFQNTDSAEIFGLELDAYREFALNDSYTKSFFISMNASYIESETEDLESPTEGRALQGQPEYTFNFILGFDDLDSGQELTLLLNQNGESVRDVGVSGTPDIIEEPAPQLDLTYSREINDAMSLSAKASNILDADIEFTQFGQTFRKYSKGVGLEVGFEWNF